MAFFPVSPTDGQQASVGNIVYQWSAATGAWNRVGTTVVPLVDGPTVTITGNLLVTGSGNSSYAGNLTVTNTLQTVELTANGNIVGLGNLSVAGNLSGVSLNLSDQVRANGNITGQRIVSNTTISAAGTITSTNNITAVNTVQGNLVLSLGDVSATGNVLGTQISGSGNITGSNLITAGLMTATGNVRGGNLISVANVTASGNISGTFFFGNGYYLTGVQTGNGGGGGAGSRATVAVSTGSIANAVNYTGFVTIAKGYAIYKVVTSGPAWVRLYSNAITQGSDLTRNQFTDPQPGAGVMVEAITTAANTVVISPAAFGWNDASPVSNSIPITITNLANTAANITVTFTYLGLET